MDRCKGREREEDRGGRAMNGEGEGENGEDGG